MRIAQIYLIKDVSFRKNVNFHITCFIENILANSGTLLVLQEIEKQMIEISVKSRLIIED